MYVVRPHAYAAEYRGRLGRHHHRMNRKCFWMRLLQTANCQKAPHAATATYWLCGGCGGGNSYFLRTHTRTTERTSEQAKMFKNAGYNHHIYTQSVCIVRICFEFVPIACPSCGKPCFPQMKLSAFHDTVSVLLLLLAPHASLSLFLSLVEASHMLRKLGGRMNTICCRMLT
jgi:hypothetical protein